MLLVYRSRVASIYLLAGVFLTAVSVMATSRAHGSSNSDLIANLKSMYLLIIASMRYQDLLLREGIVISMNEVSGGCCIMILLWH